MCRLMGKRRRMCRFELFGRFGRGGLSWSPRRIWIILGHSSSYHLLEGFVSRTKVHQGGVRLLLLVKQQLSLLDDVFPSKQLLASV